jgi:hypothetical protein
MTTKRRRKTNRPPEATGSGEAARSPELDAMRIRHEYKRLILLGKIAAPLSAARRIVGPDCAFHLYSKIGKR